MAFNQIKTQIKSECCELQKNGFRSYFPNKETLFDGINLKVSDVIA